MTIQFYNHIAVLIIIEKRKNLLFSICLKIYRYSDEKHRKYITRQIKIEHRDKNIKFLVNDTFRLSIELI